MKILYVDIFGETINPTASLMPLLFRTVAPDAVFYGPGLASAANLELGLERFIERFGPFDVAMFGPSIPVLADVADPVGSTTRYLQRFTALLPTASLIAPFLKDVLGAAGRIPVSTKIISTLNFDYYACSPAQIDSIEALGLHILGPNRQFVHKLVELPDYAKEERHFRRKAERLGDAYADFVAAHPERVITATHFVAETEFTARHTDTRTHPINVPGVEYVLRGRALKALARSGSRIAPKRIFHLYRLLGGLGLAVFAHYLPLKLYHLTFQQGLMDSQLVYTARGGFGIPIRKFFEIPAAGALMICIPPYGFDALGFRDSEHYLEAEPETLPALVAELSHQPERVARIARAGQTLVFAQHSLTERARQIRACLKVLVAGTYRGANWVNGEFVLRGELAQAALRH
jgi:glycosyl transferase family 1